MKITAVETHVCNARMRNWVFVRVLTDEPGLVGWGEATLEWHTRGVVGAIADLEPLLLGQDPTRVEHLWQRMFRQQFWHGNNLVRGTAISGIDLALWDILGKVHGVPCHRLWGGPVRDRIRLYAHVGGGRLDFYESEARAVRGARAAGWSSGASRRSRRCPCRRRCRSRAWGRFASRSRTSPRCAMRSGTRSTSWSTATPARRPRWGRSSPAPSSRSSLFWLEEPCWPEHPEAIAEIARSVRTPVATGERLVGLHAFRDLLASRACAIVQPDITHCGGLSEARRIAALAEAYGVALAPHNPQGPVSTAASLELGFATPSYVICEAVSADVPWRGEVVQEGFTVHADGRYVTPSERPGLGVEIDLDAVARHPFRQEMPQGVFYPDGAVGDW